MPFNDILIEVLTTLFLLIFIFPGILFNTNVLFTRFAIRGIFVKKINIIYVHLYFIATKLA